MPASSVLLRVHTLEDAFYGKGSTFGLFCSRVTGIHNQNRRNRQFLRRIVVVYLGHGIFHPVAVLFFSPNQFLGEVLRTQN